ncbi:SusC/RagA family TonB-linked outer membrane protein [Carboxylicivirga sp. A043]|uniref:SusC/RagA family TonB-linked outer membrane protein n=1 Tax=Carboxylicivirga litoralis TaxID=2816963 RepID=UPI0021CB58F9|nr:SusC/RagA family TonB-linked outer membrane protein [Carboxylicivirga sp. A043]MCU4155548.1 SusC/RagA family TonB-linked outer membrane protein [Carboxylicivirga sp. A043]
MKKNKTIVGIPWNQLKKLARIMKLCVLFMIVGMIQISAASYGQSAKVSINLKKSTLSKVFDEIENQSDFNVFYSKEDVNENQLVDVNASDKDIEEILDKVLNLNEYKYHIIDQDIIITKRYQTLDASAGQQQLKVSGIVTDDTGEPLPGVNVFEKDNVTNGTITSIDGSYELNVSGTEAVIKFSFIGYADQELNLAGRNTINVTMVSDALDIDEVVVTALGIKREKKALGYAVQDVKSEELTQAGDADLISSLQGKVAGVQINQSGGGIGGTSRIDIRGASSLTDNNAPLWVVDGVPFDNGNERDGSIWGGTSRAGGAFDLNPEDIESVSILKGPNAAALYGERGGNGVIVVTTKKGKSRKGLGISYAGGVTFSEASYMLDLQDRYGQGTDGVYYKDSEWSWGPEMKGQDLEAWTGETIPFTAQKNRLKDFTRTGLSHKHNVAFTGGNEDGTFRVSVGKDIMNGIYEDHKVEKTTFDFRGDYNINSWLNIDTKLSYFVTDGDQRPEIGNYSYVSYFNSMPRNIRNQDLKPGYNIVSGEHVEKLYTTVNANNRNPYFLQAQTDNSDSKNRTFGYIAANIKLHKNLKAKFKYGLDFYQFNAVEGYLYADNVDSSRPNYNTEQSNFKEENYEFLLSYNKTFNDDWAIGLNLGANNMSRMDKRLRGTSGRLSSEGDYFLGAGSNINATESITESEVRSVYGFGQVAYRNMIFFDFTGRNDWSSTLTSADADYDNSYFYPSLSLSGLISEMIDMPSWVSFAKARASWAQVGKATDPYNTSQLYKLESWNYGLTTGIVPEDAVIENLKPEISTSWEAGLDLRFFNNRLGLDFTYYNELTKNQIVNIEVVQSSGYKTKYINAGEISNKGIELMLSTVPVKTRDFTLGLDFNFSKNEGVLEKLHEDLKEYDFGSNVWAVEGGQLGDIRGSVYARNEQGQIIVDDKGLPTLAQGSDHVLGNIQADWTGSINLTADYKGLYMSALFSVQQGGDILSSSERGATSAGTAKRTDANDRMAFFVDGVTADGGANNVMVSAEEYWRQVAKVDEEFMYDASHMKLKEIVLGYNVPKSLLERISANNPIQSMRISLVGRNLWYLYKDTPGTVPDASAYSSAYAAQAFDFAPVPSTRTYGFSINLGF